MAAPNIDAVERYVARLHEYIDEKEQQKRVYKPTILRLYVIRNALVLVVNRLNRLIEKYSPNVDLSPAEKCCADFKALKTGIIDPPDTDDPSVMDAVNKKTPLPNNVEDLDAIVQQLVTQCLQERDSATASSCRAAAGGLPKQVVTKTAKATPTKLANSETTKHSSATAKEVVCAYRDMFDRTNFHSSNSLVCRETMKFLRAWFETKILNFNRIKEINPKANYNPAWIPQLMRDIVIYIGNNHNRIEACFRELYQFLQADSSQAGFTSLVPYEVFKLGRSANRKSVSEFGVALWYQLYSDYLFVLKLPVDSIYYANKSLVDCAYLTSDAEVDDKITPEFVEASNWVNSCSFSPVSDSLSKEVG